MTRKYRKKIDALVKDFNADIGIYIKNIKNDKTVMVNADTVFPTASIVKVPILIVVMDKEMLRLLSRNYWDEQAISQIPPDVFVASKNGAVNQSRSEVLFVNGEKAQYIFRICTKNNKDESWEPGNEDGFFDYSDFMIGSHA